MQIADIPALNIIDIPKVEPRDDINIVRKLRRDPKFLALLMSIIIKAHGQKLHGRTVEVLHVVFIHIPAGRDIGYEPIV